MPAVAKVVRVGASGGGGVPSTRVIATGNGLSGGGDLSVDRTHVVVAHPDGSIVVGPAGVQVGTLAGDSQHGSLGGGSLHALATVLQAGFMSPGDKAKVDELYGLRAEDAEMILIPEGPVTGQGQRLAQLTFEGASFVVRRRVIFDRMRIRFNAVPASGNFVIAIYQEPDGRSGPAARVASAVFAATAAGAFNIPVSEGVVQLVPGLCYVLFGRRTGTQQLSIYAKPTIALLCDPAFSAPNLHPTDFATNIPTGAFPATFNPLPTTGGGNTTASTIDVTPQIRLWKV